MGKRFLFLILVVFGFTQPKECPEVSVFSVAPGGHFYLASSSNVIYKCNSEGTILVRQNDKSDGKIHSMDASNPFEVYVYYEDQGVLVFMDNQLAERGRTTLLKHFTNPPVALARSYNNGIWIYNIENQQLEQYDKQWKRLVESPNLPVLTGMEVFPTRIYDDGKWVYLTDPENGVLVFDLFGNYKGLWRFSDVNDLYLKKDKAWILTNQYLLTYQPAIFQTDTIMTFKPGEYLQLEGYDQEIHLLKKGGNIYSFPVSN